MDITIARNLLIQPDRLLSLLEHDKHDDKQSNVKCFYALHAILLTLVKESCDGILNQMSDYHINVLKHCITIAQQYKRPEEAVIQKLITKRQAKSTGLISESEFLVNETMKLTLQIALQVGALWDKAVAELQKWSDVTNNFVRTPLAQSIPAEQQSAEPNPTESLQPCTLDELARLTGFRDKKTLMGKKKRFVERCKDREKVKEVKSWFIYPNGGKPALFRTEHASELKALLMGGNATPQGKIELWTLAEVAQKMGYPNAKTFRWRKKRVLDKYKGTAKANEIKSWFIYPEPGQPGLFKAEYYDQLVAAFAPQHSAPVVAKPSKTTKTLVDIQGIEAYLTALQELCQNVRNELKNAENTYNDIIGKAANAQISKRRDLLQQAIDTNDIISQYQDTLNEFQDRCDNVSDLLKRRQQAVETLRTVDTEIAKLLAEFKNQRNK